MCNMADYPTSVFPVTKVIPEVDTKVAPHQFRSTHDSTVFGLCQCFSLSHDNSI